MKKVMVAVLMCLLALPSFALVEDQAMSTFIERLVERKQIDISSSPVNISTEISKEKKAEIKALQEVELGELTDFAAAIGLFDRGFEYKIDKDIFKVTMKNDGKLVAYTFSISIIQNGKVTAKSLFEVEKRVDGILFISRASNYLFE